MCDAEYYEGCCERCEETTQVLDNDIIGETICDKCFDEHYDRCTYCDDKFCLKSSLNEDGWCEGCVSRAGKCEDCEMPFEEDDLEDGFCYLCRVTMKKAVVKCFPKIMKLIEDAKKPKKIKLKILDEVYVP